MDRQNKDSFILYGNQSKQIEMLSNEDAGSLIKKIYRYANGEDVKEYQLSPIAEMLYSIIEDQITRDREKYDEICRHRQEAGRLGGRPRKEKPNAFDDKAKCQGSKQYGLGYHRGEEDTIDKFSKRLDAVEDKVEAISQ